MRVATRRMYRKPSLSWALPQDTLILRRLAQTHLLLQLIFLLWKSPGGNFVALWALTSHITDFRSDHQLATKQPRPAELKPARF